MVRHAVQYDRPAGDLRGRRRPARGDGGAAAMSRAPVLAALDRLPRFALAALPTPLERAANLSRAPGGGLWVKRDDLTGLALGGSPVELLPRPRRGGCARGTARPSAPARHRSGAGAGEPAARPPPRRRH